MKAQGNPDPDDLAARLREHPRIARLREGLADTPGCWLVGGAVRDLLLGSVPLDLDVVVEGDAAAAAREAAERLGGQARLHERFGTATVAASGLSFDLVTARRERYPAPGALPEVEPAPLDEDLGRRDFTVHALALGLSRGREGELRQAPEGLADLQARRLRVLHDNSFLDDPTRLLRLVRYGARLGFAPEPHTAELAQDAVRNGALATVSGARISGELMLLLDEPAALEGLERARAVGLLRALHPHLRFDRDLAARVLARLPEGGRRDLTLLAACVTDFPREELGRWLDWLALPAAEREAVIAAALGGEALARQLAAADRPSQIAALARHRPSEQLAVAAALGAGPQVARWADELRHVRLEISGDDLIAAGVPEGPAVGRGLATALARKLDGAPGGREAELRDALDAAGGADSD
jgi:tRNA nucleotidyltransferase (CCA-adding enzyme)